MHLPENGSKSMNGTQQDFKPRFREVSQDEIDHLPSPVHRAVAMDYLKRGFWRLKKA